MFPSFHLPHTGQKEGAQGVHSNPKLTTTSMSDTTGSVPHMAGLNLQLFKVCRVASSIERAALPTS